MTIERHPAGTASPAFAAAYREGPDRWSHSACVNYLAIIIKFDTLMRTYSDALKQLCAGNRL
jgi:hypothetical protein